MAIDPQIQQKANDIRTKIYGQEVREALASGLETISEVTAGTPLIDLEKYQGEKNAIPHTDDNADLIAGRGINFHSSSGRDFPTLLASIMARNDGGGVTLSGITQGMFRGDLTGDVSGALKQLSVTDWNIEEEGLCCYAGEYGTANAPTTNKSCGISVIYNEEGFQIASEGSVNSYIYFRTKRGGVWTEWEKFATVAELSGKASIEKWTCPVRVGTWSRVGKLTGYSNCMFGLAFAQDSQSCYYQYTMGTAWDRANISQMITNGSEANSAIQVRLVRDVSNAMAFYIEVLNPYGFNGATEVAATCSFMELSKNNIAILTKYTAYTATVASPLIKDSIISKYDGMVTKKVYGDLVGNATSADVATNALTVGKSTSYTTLSGWNRIIQSNTSSIGAGRCSADITCINASGSVTAVFRLDCALSFGKQPKITITNLSHYAIYPSNPAAITGVRIVYDETAPASTAAYIEVNCSGINTIYIQNLQSQGTWGILNTSAVAGSVPSGYKSAEIALNYENTVQTYGLVNAPELLWSGSSSSGSITLSKAVSMFRFLRVHFAITSSSSIADGSSQIVLVPALNSLPSVPYGTDNGTEGFATGTLVLYINANNISWSPSQYVLDASPNSSMDTYSATITMTDVYGYR